MGNDYETSKDEELILRIRDGEEKITDYIMEKYKNLVRSKAGSMYILGADREDLIQEGMIGLFKAIRDYDIGRDASFATFADLCVARQMYVSLYAGNGSDKTEEEKKLLDSLVSRDEQNPEELLIDRENVERIEKAIESELSSFERQVLDLYLTGMKYTEIARVLGKDDKSTDNALQRCRSKIRKALLTGKD